MPSSDSDAPADVLAIRDLIDLGSNGILALADAIERVDIDLKPLSEHSGAIGETLTAHKIPVDEEKLTAILEHAVEQCVVSRLDVDASAEVFVDVIQRTAQDRDYFPSGFDARVQECREPLIRLLGLDALSLRVKAISLVSERANWVGRLRILTEMRPIFDEAGQSIRAQLIVNTLQLTYDADDEVRTSYFAIDPIDLDTLEREIQRARIKNDSVLAQCEIDSLPALGYGLGPGEKV